MNEKEKTKGLEFGEKINGIISTIVNAGMYVVMKNFSKYSTNQYDYFHSRDTFWESKEWEELKKSITFLENKENYERDIQEILLEVLDDHMINLANRMFDEDNEIKVLVISKYDIDKNHVTILKTIWSKQQEEKKLLY